MAQEYPLINVTLAKPYSINVYVQPRFVGPRLHPRTWQLWQLGEYVGTERLQRLILEENQGADRELTRFELNEFGQLRMWRSHGDVHGVWLTAWLDEDENPDEVYKRISAALEPHGWELQ